MDFYDSTFTEGKKIQYTKKWSYSADCIRDETVGLGQWTLGGKRDTYKEHMAPDRSLVTQLEKGMLVTVSA